MITSICNSCLPLFLLAQIPDTVVLIALALCETG